MAGRVSDGKPKIGAKKTSIFRGLILAMLSGICFSLVSVIVKKLKNLHPGQIALYRFIVIFVTTFPQTIQVGQNPLGPKKFRFHLLLRGILGAISMLLNFMAMQYLSLSEATVIIFSYPVFVTVVARIFLKEPCSVPQCFAVAVTVTGIIFTAKLPAHLTQEHIVYSKERLCGLFAAIGSVLCNSFAIPLVRMVKSVPQAVNTFNYGLVTMILTLLMTAIFGNFRWHHCGIEAFYIVLLGLFSAFGQAMMVWALQCELSGPVATVRSASDIGLAFVWQILIFQVDPDPYCIIGSALVVFSIVFIGYSKWSTSRSSSLALKNAEAGS